MHAAAAQPLAILHSSGTPRKRRRRVARHGFLPTHPAADDGCAVGVPNETLGELSRTCIVPRDGAMNTRDEPKEYATT
jgi:hypothetical protein